MVSSSSSIPGGRTFEVLNLYNNGRSLPELCQQYNAKQRTILEHLWKAVQALQCKGRLQSRADSCRGGHVDHIGTACICLRENPERTWASAGATNRQWARVPGRNIRPLGQQTWDGDPVHPGRKTQSECVHRAVESNHAGRTARSNPVCQTKGCPGSRILVAAGIQ